MTLDFANKRKVPNWLLCNERIVHNPVSLFTISFVVAARTGQTFSLREFYNVLAHKDPVNVVFEGGCGQEECWKLSSYREKVIHNHLLPTDSSVFYNPYFMCYVQHIYAEKFDYVALPEETIDEKSKTSITDQYSERVGRRKIDQVKRAKARRRLQF